MFFPFPHANITGAVGGQGGGSSAAPTLTWSSDTATATPTFFVDFDEGVAVDGSTITIQVADNINFTDPILYTLPFTLDAGDIIAGDIDVDGTGLTSGQWWARAKLDSGPWSNVETKTLVLTNDDNDYAAWLAAA